jgi:Zn-dependent protease with chaperone function/Zn-finger nucleic acid-binding protein
MERRVAPDFYEIQKEQKAKTRGLFAALVLFYVAGVAALFFVLDVAAGSAFGRPQMLRPSYFIGLLVLAALFSLALAAFQLFDARRNGAAFILKRLGAEPPDMRDRYHRLLFDVVEEMRIAAGVGGVKVAVIPDHAINSLALVEADGTPCVAMTEGLLAEFTRDEVQAAVAHELAHIVSGDALFLTLVCSIADFYERLTDGLRSKSEARGSESLPPTVVIMRLLDRFIGRERELLADAAAVELGRSPVPLARALYKAHLKNSFVGDFSLTYAPLFIVAPALADEPEKGRGGWTDSHPPVMKRIRRLAEMANLKPDEIIRQVWEFQSRREASKTLERGFDETPRPVPFRKPKGSASSWQGLCPRCRVPLSEDSYEGAPIRVCRTCGGKLIDQDAVGRVLQRTEVGFSPALREKARTFRETFLRNPLKTKKIADLGADHPLCPSCGYRMVTRPYNYQYFVPVEKCLSCYEIWFDADEMEILQILVEEAKRDPSPASP